MGMAAVYKGDRTVEVETRVSGSPARNEIQLSIAYCGLCGTDLHIFLGDLDQRVGTNRIIGHEVSAIVSALGEGVSDFKVGQPVTVQPILPCGACGACRAGHNHVCQNLVCYGLDETGGLQETWTVPAQLVHALPEGLDLKTAALVEPLTIACHDVVRGRVQPNETVLIIGAGPIGLLTALVARKAGANVVISEVNSHRLQYARSLNFKTIDPSKTDAKAEVEALTDGQGMDVVFEVSGTQAGVDLMTEAAAVRGRMVMVAIHAQRRDVDLYRIFARELELIGARVSRPEDYHEAIRLLEAGLVDAGTFITDERPLSQVQSAFDELSKNAAAIKSVIRIGGG